MSGCTLCPRGCNVDRELKQTGYCGQTDEIRCARASLHMWEEPCISGESGSGTVFFSGCQLKCVFCQNHDIALGQAGKLISKERLVDIFFELKDKGANNINLVTPTHFVPQIAECLEMAKAKGLGLPIVYNTSSYENVDTLKRLDGLVDIYLPDMKYFDPALAKRYSNAPDYFEVASKAIAEMVRQQPECEFVETQQLKGDNGTEAVDVSEQCLIRRGVIVRHLVLPSHTEDSKRIIKYLYETYSDKIYISIMNQFTPVCDLSEYPNINRKITAEEYDEVVDYAIDLGVENGFIQEGDTAEESFIPAFDLLGV